MPRAIGTRLTEVPGRSFWASAAWQRLSARILIGPSWYAAHTANRLTAATTAPAGWAATSRPPHHASANAGRPTAPQMAMHPTENAIRPAACRLVEWPEELFGAALIVE